MSHEAPGKSNEWFTPKYVFDALETQFDLDVASPVDRSHVHVPSKQHFTAGALEKEWNGFVWMNPPFGNRKTKMEWLTKFFDHGNGVALTPDRTCAEWWHYAASRASAVLFTHGRVKFIRPDGSVGDSPGTSTCLWATGGIGFSALKRAPQNGLGLLCPLTGWLYE